MNKIGQIFHSAFLKERHIAPLATFRVAFGAIMFISAVRFLLKGWVSEFYLRPSFHFTFYGFDWVKPCGQIGMYAVFAVMMVASVGIMVGCFYRLSIAAFFFSFLYVELLDKTYYLNHYYLVTLLAFLLMLVPANRYFALDVWRDPSSRVTHVPGWTITIFQLQLFLVYFLAGVAKINPSWLIDALPLKIWLPANGHLPVLGYWLKQPEVAYLFSWFGAVYDLTIVFFLWNNKTRNAAFLAVVIFHLLTAILFKIGMFPYIMIGATLIFFPDTFHRKFLEKIGVIFKRNHNPTLTQYPSSQKTHTLPSLTRVILTTYFLLQLALPFRYLLYPGDLYWTEEGFRFSWRVMLMEKSGLAFFYVEDPETGRKTEVQDSKFITPFQQRMMATQPDMILQYAHFLDDKYRRKGIKDPVVTVQSYVTLNGKGSQLFIDSAVDLSREEESFYPKSWILSQDQISTLK